MDHIDYDLIGEWQWSGYTVYIDFFSWILIMVDQFEYVFNDHFFIYVETIPDQPEPAFGWPENEIQQ